LYHFTVCFFFLSFFFADSSVQHSH
jgi:hypothetical protein